MPSFYVGAGNLNLGPYICMAGILHPPPPGYQESVSSDSLSFSKAREEDIAGKVLRRGEPLSVGTFILLPTTCRNGIWAHGKLIGLPLHRSL